MSELYWQLRRLQEANRCADCTYHLWERWKNAPQGATRRMALVAKARAVITWDQVMFGG